MPLEEQADIAEAFVADLAKEFGATVSFEREQVADDEIRVTVTGENIGRMIGQRGTTAGAVDELVAALGHLPLAGAEHGQRRWSGHGQDHGGTQPIAGPPIDAEPMTGGAQLGEGGQRPRGRGVVRTLDGGQRLGQCLGRPVIQHHPEIPS